MSHITHHSHVSHYLLYINSAYRLYNITALDQLPLSSQVVYSTQKVSWSSSSSTYIGIAPTGHGRNNIMWFTNKSDKGIKHHTWFKPFPWPTLMLVLVAVSVVLNICP